MATDKTLAQTTDTELARLYEASHKVAQDLQSVANSIHYAVGDKKVWHGKRQEWTSTLEECLARGLPATRTLGYHQNAYKEALASLNALRAEAKRLDEQTAALDAVFAAHKWSRFFLVQNTDGHIHRSLHCSTCHPTTRYGWLPDLSGLTEADAVAAHGARLCTVCFPSAPVEWTNAIELAQAAKRAKFCSGKTAKRTTDPRLFYQYGTCTTCGAHVSITSTGKARAHKPEVQA